MLRPIPLTVAKGGETGLENAALVTVLMSEGAEHCCAMLDEFGVAYETQLTASTKVVIASGDRAGEAASQTVFPVLAVPMESSVDALRATSQLPVAVLAIGKAGAVNAALLAVAILANDNLGLRDKLVKFRERQTAGVLGVEL